MVFLRAKPPLTEHALRVGGGEHKPGAVGGCSGEPLWVQHEVLGAVALCRVTVGLESPGTGRAVVFKALCWSLQWSRG